MAYIAKEPLCAWLEHMGVSRYIIDTIKNEEHFPTADVVEVVHGDWILHNDGSGTCKVCGRHQKIIWDMCAWQRYCGHCGAKMDGKDTNVPTK